MRSLLVVAAALALFMSCTPRGEDKNSPQKSSLAYPERAKDMTIYEVNIRQHTPEGTFNAFAKDLPRLKELGVDMLWIMPVQPIGKKNRKGGLGSYYSISDYTSTNPEYGTLEEFKTLVKEAHQHGMQVILDWVPNHTAWDHTWITEHPSFYMTDSSAAIIGKSLNAGSDYYKKGDVGNIVHEADWEDIALINLFNPQARKAMIQDMKFWITEADIDGFRADHAGHEIPMYFWEEATSALNQLKDLFWLAEWDEPKMHIAFHATYDWTLLGLTSEVAKGKRVAEDIHEHILKDQARYGLHAVRLNMINNHDENAWHGTVKERYGDGEKAFAVFSFTAYGAPVLYSGQEVGLNKRLKFFEKDSIDWSDPEKHAPFYTQLNKLKAENPALFTGAYGGMTLKIEDNNKDVFSFIREKDNNAVIGIINMSATAQTIQLRGVSVEGFTEYFTGAKGTTGEIKLAPWQYMIFIK